MTGDRSLILDFGGVVTRTLFETHYVTERALGLAAGTLTWRGPCHPVVALGDLKVLHRYPEWIG
ncbi:hypothetical protein ACC846_39105, partial [Rhizobium ruizarguesonis]